MNNADIEHIIMARKCIYELDCDLCGKHLGYVSEYDMNENYVVCDDCLPTGVIVE